VYRLWRHKNGIWYILHGPRLKSRISTRHRDQLKARAVLDRISEIGNIAPTESPSVGDLLLEYERDCAPTIWAPKTLRRSIRSLKKHLGNLRPDQITASQTKRYAQARKVSDETVLHELATLRAALQHGVLQDRIVTAPFVPPPPSTPERQVRWLTKDEGRALVAACRDYNLKLFVVLTLMTAAPPLAVVDLRWGQLDLDRRVITFESSADRRSLPFARINDELFGYLQAAQTLLRHRAPAEQFDDRVLKFRGKTLASVRLRFKHACHKAGLPDASLAILRHTSAVWMAEAGIPLEDIALVLGEEQRTVERRYGQFAPGFMVAAANALKFRE
jgi:integrase